MKNQISLPDLESVKKGIDELLLIEKWDKYKIRSSPKKFEKRLRELFTSKLGILPHVILMPNENSYPFRFYRLRKKTKFMNERIISEYSYPPNHIVKSIQRANIPYYPVFYCSDVPLTAIYETVAREQKLNKQAIYYLSEWQPRPLARFKICPFLFGNVHESNPYKPLSDHGVDNLKQQLKDYPTNEIEGFIKVLQFLSQLFVFDNTYIISSFIAHSNLYAEHNLRPDIFIYPSVQTDRKSVNFAIHPNTVSESLVLNRVLRINVHEINRDKCTCTITISHVGQNNSGQINWKVINRDTEEGQKIIEELKRDFFLI